MDDEIPDELDLAEAQALVNMSALRELGKRMTLLEQRVAQNIEQMETLWQRLESVVSDIDAISNNISSITNDR